MKQLKAYFHITNVDGFIALCKADNLYMGDASFTREIRNRNDSFMKEALTSAPSRPICSFAANSQNMGLHEPISVFKHFSPVTAEAVSSQSTNVHQLRCNYYPRILGNDPLAYHGAASLIEDGIIEPPLFMQDTARCLLGQEPSLTKDKEYKLEWVSGILDPVHPEGSVFLEVPYGSSPSGITRFCVLPLLPDFFNVGHVVYLSADLTNNFQSAPKSVEGAPEAATPRRH